MGQDAGSTQVVNNIQHYVKSQHRKHRCNVATGQRIAEQLCMNGWLMYTNQETHTLKRGYSTRHFQTGSDYNKLMNIR